MRCLNDWTNNKNDKSTKTNMVIVAIAYFVIVTYYDAISEKSLFHAKLVVTLH